MSEVNVISRTQHIIVEPFSSSVSVINAGPPGPNTGIPGPPGVVQSILAGPGISVNSNTPASPIISANAELSGPYKETSIGGLPAGPYSWPSPFRDVGDYAGAAPSIYTTAGGALKAGIYGVATYISANVSDGGDLTLCLQFAGFPHVQTAKFLYAGFGGYVERQLSVGQHITWQMYKHAPMVSFATTIVGMQICYRPVNA